MGLLLVTVQVRLVEFPMGVAEQVNHVNLNLKILPRYILSGVIHAFGSNNVQQHMITILLFKDLDIHLTLLSLPTN